MSRPPSRGAGGCDFAARPSRSGRDQPIHWTPDADPAVIILAAAPDGLTPPTPVPLELSAIRDAPEGFYARHGEAEAGVPVLLLSGAAVDHACGAFVPFAADSRDRVEAFLRLWASGRGRAAPDTRLTSLQRRRIPRALRAADARDEGASYREIAAAFHGAARLAREGGWRDSALRTEVIDLAKAGVALIAGGYLDLFRHRRRS